MPERINVTKSFLPPLVDYQREIEEIWESGQLTNHGEKCLALQAKLQEHLGIKHVVLLNNGTMALQLAIKALNLSGEIITTPFSYVATVSSIVWEGCDPIFVDINETDLCIDPGKIESAITDQTTAILATHVYGHPCKVKAIDEVAKKHGLRVIYDAAHAFGIRMDGRSILNHGDISTLSFHATKIFHTAEGGAVVTNNDELAHRLRFLGNFGHNGEEAFWGLGVNAKMSELQAAMGLCVLPRMPEIVKARQSVSEAYDTQLNGISGLRIVRPDARIEYNYAYYPVIFECEEDLITVREALNKANIYPRRYFYPSLNKLPYLEPVQKMPVADDVSTRILCLPLSAGLKHEEVTRISALIRDNL